VTWSCRDILDEAESRGIELTDKQTHDILNTVIHGYDASVGINWDIVSSNIQFSRNLRYSVETGQGRPESHRSPQTTLEPRTLCQDMPSRTKLS